MNRIEIYARRLYRLLNDLINIEKNGRRLYRDFFDEHSAIYIHIPKTGGTSVSNALFEKDPGHYFLKRYEQVDKVKFESYFKFSIVRHPVDRLVSTYNYLIARKAIYKDPYHPYSFLAKYDFLEDFIINGLSQELIESNYFFASQTEYLQNSQGNIQMDYIGKLESINDDFKVICSKLNLKKNIQNKNSSNKLVTKKELSRAALNKIFEVYKDDFLNFEYNQNITG